jgi:hypothetical protein
LILFRCPLVLFAVGLARQPAAPGKGHRVKRKIDHSSAPAINSIQGRQINILGMPVQGGRNDFAVVTGRHYPTADSACDVSTARSRILLL